MQTLSILITGASGQLGTEFRQLSQNNNYHFIFADKTIIDFTNLPTTREFFTVNPINIIINCGAYTGVDKAESEREQCETINSKAVACLAQLAAEQKILLIHFSTDYVFDGKGFYPYPTDHPCDPINHYGQTKRNGELAMLDTPGLQGLIIRTSWVYSQFGNNFVKTMIRLGKERPDLNVIDDQIGSPTYAGDLADFVLRAIPHINWEGVRIYHYSNEGVCSWYDFAHAIMHLQKIECHLKPIPTTEYPTPAKRPHYSVLDKSTTKRDFSIEIPHWRDSLEKCLQKL